MSLAVGQRVRSATTVRPKEYANRVGTVRRFNEGEIGVDFGNGRDVWFRPAELTAANTRHSPNLAPLADARVYPVSIGAGAASRTAEANAASGMEVPR